MKTSAIKATSAITISSIILFLLSVYQICAYAEGTKELNMEVSHKFVTLAKGQNYVPPKQDKC